MSEEKIIPDFNFEVDSPDDDNTPEASRNDEEQAQSKEYAENADDNIIAAYNYYRDAGLIGVDYEDFDGTQESLQAVLAAEREAEREGLLNHIMQASPEFARPLVELILNKGNELTAEEAASVFNMVKPSEYTKDSFKEEAVAEKFLTDYYMKEFGDTKEDAEERIDLLKDKGKLNREAEKIFSRESELKAKLVNEVVDNSKLAKQQREQAEAAYNQTFVDSLKDWREDTKKAVQQEFYGGAFKQRLEHILQNPAQLARLVHVMSYYDGNVLNLDSFAKEGGSSTNNKRKGNLQNYWASSSNRGGGRVVSSNKEEFNPADFEIEL